MNQTVTTPEAIDVFSMTITREVGEDYSVRSVDILGSTMRHRVSFTQTSRIRDVFQPDLADCIESILERLPPNTHVFSDPDFIIELPGLTLARLRVLIQVAANGASQIILRFRYFIGGLQSVFRVDAHMRIPTLEHRERIAVEALADIATPMFSLALANMDHVRTAHDKELVQRKLEELSGRASEINFYLSLLTRYVTACSKESLEQTEQHDQPRMLGYG